MSDLKTENKNYWFPAKKIGWGWGFPNTWQGWATFAVYLLALVAAYFIFPLREDKNILIFILITFFLSAALIAVCFIKGEPPTKGRSKD